MMTSEQSTGLGSAAKAEGPTQGLIQFKEDAEKKKTCYNIRKVLERIGRNR